eukprot:TRINITY_DN26238_c0_g1_i1.p1 TRINITY_DN26238_c0_g1~~TRINITY_DN26238_c0_g1_i1.p1  ORF type:complete len:237 (+),score=41.17 TRINITY_DN26238_c0_g1_i1:91-801(+)
MSAYVQGWKHPDKQPVNFLLFGAKETGKSSIVNLMSSLLSKNVDRIAKRDVEYLEQYSLTPNITIWDSKGWENGSSYTKLEFNKILRGISQKAPNSGIDVVIFVVDDKSKNHIHDLKPYYDAAKKSCKHVCVAVTKLDQTDSKIAMESDSSQMRLLFRNSVALQNIKKLLEGWDKNLSVFPVLNYREREDRREPIKEETVEMLLKDILYFAGRTPTKPNYDYFAGEQIVQAVYKTK